jgi:phage tail sheath protein FI
LARIRIPPITIRLRAPSASREILGVDTSTAALVGAPAAGAPNDAELVTSVVDYEREFGAADDDLRRAVRLFFDNGGRRAYVLRPQSDVAAGLRKLEDVPFALLALPESGSLDPGDAETVAGAAIELCQRRRAFAVLDPPAALAPEDVAAWAASLGPTRHAAIYVPRLQVAAADAAASGAVVGVYARTDIERGVWRAPAGTAADVRGAVGVTLEVTDSTIATLAQEGVNVLRRLDNRLVVWGARTLSTAGADWRYVNVCRFALFLERSIAEGTRWAVFEPNGEGLWREVRRKVETFMSTLFRQGAFAASAAEEAYYVRCDRTTMTQDDIDNGRLVIVVGFAPHRPAEFLVIRINENQ